MTQLTTDQVRAIHSVLDTTTPVVAAHPEVVAVWAENTSEGSREARYELVGGGSTYLTGQLSKVLEPCQAHNAATYPGAIRFTAREVANWPTMKAEMRALLSEDRTGCDVAWWDPSRNKPWRTSRGMGDMRALDEYGYGEALARGLCFTRDMLDPSHATTSEPTVTVSGTDTGRHMIRVVVTPGYSAADHYVKSRQVAIPWTIPTGAAVCAVCDSPCHVKNSGDLFTAEDGDDYPLCDTCWAGNDGEDWDDATSQRILRSQSLDDKQIAAMQLRQDERAKKVAKLAETLRQKVEARYPHEGRSERVYDGQNPRFR